MSSKPHTIKRKQWLTIKVLELYAKGNSYRQIADIMQITVHRVRIILQSINNKTGEALDRYFVDQAPLGYQSTLVLIDMILRKSMELADTSKDPRVVLQALDLAHDMSVAKNQLLVDSMKLADYLKKQRQRAVVYTTTTTTTTEQEEQQQTEEREKEEIIAT